MDQELIGLVNELQNTFSNLGMTMSSPWKTRNMNALY